MTRLDWPQTWMSVAVIVGKRSRCTRAQVGAVIVDSKMRVIATGYNGPAAGYQVEGDCSNWCERAKTGESNNTYDNCPAIHAEANALLYVDRSKMEDAAIFITHAPCFSCAKLISNSGISHVIVLKKSGEEHREPDKVYEYLKECNIQVHEMIDEKND